MKSTLEQIRERFDHDVDRFSNLNTGQKTAIDGALCLDLIASGVAAMHADATDLLDVGCGAGNWTLKLLQRVPNLRCTLVDLSQPMLDRARERVLKAGAREIRCIQSDIRACDFAAGAFDVIVAGAVLHHLRTEDDWQRVTGLFYRGLKPGGSVWVYDMVRHELPAVERQMRDSYFAYLSDLQDRSFAEKVFAYIEQEDSPWPVTFQIQQLRQAGFNDCDVLHKNGLFAAYVARK